MKSRTGLAAARKAGPKPRNPHREIRTKTGTRAGNFVARRYRVHPAFADLIATLAGFGEDSRP
jgi:hypothetical protein